MKGHDDNTPLCELRIAPRIPTAGPDICFAMCGGWVRGPVRAGLHNPSRNGEAKKLPSHTKYLYSR